MALLTLTVVAADITSAVPTITITDDKGAQTSETFEWTVSDVLPVATPALPDRSVNDGTAVTVATSGGFTNPNKVPYTYTATGLPKGLSLDRDTGVISGTIDHDASTAGNGGTYTISVTADDRQCALARGGARGRTRGGAQGCGSGVRHVGHRPMVTKPSSLTSPDLERPRCVSVTIQPRVKADR